ncbi:hypothetical protein ciss_01980 [Carboxydothermus islandicus]|uniref:Uncharacterized protein n=1 Tax=Carboxydothermus islandicus TaxID=661089 RepID=A0A1L8CZA1_9THEO|nr:hypothetical protein ciss_01980 [Carboxydothermus islandicus]
MEIVKTTSSTRDGLIVLIEPLWDGNQEWGRHWNGGDYVLIEPLWDGNVYCLTQAVILDDSFNRTIVGWKYGAEERISCVGVSFNRTIVGWKCSSATSWAIRINLF